MEGLIVGALVLMLIMLGYVGMRMLKDAPDRSKLVRLETELAYEKRASAEKLQVLQDAEVRLKTEFENLANRIIEDKGRLITAENRERLTGLLQPFKEQLESFRGRVDEVHKQGTEQSARLVEQVRQLQEMSGRVSDEANHLAKAIRGDAKTQGDWGELIVERIFEASGLENGREYTGQTSMRDEQGRIKRPDFIVHLPQDKAVIVDSKVSLTAYERYSQAEEETAKNAALAEHVASVRRHMEDLLSKDYTGLLGGRSLDFVIMCIPLEPAYQTVMQADRELIYDLARTRVVITGPTTLMITLKLIAQIWRRENENRNAEVIADQAGRLYDQVALIAEAMLDAQRKLASTTGAFDLVLKRLTDGRGNLLKRVNDLRQLGAKVNKTMPQELIAQALTEDDQD